jgi:two-component system, NarL family, sensor histidine kinase DesK
MTDATTSEPVVPVGSLNGAVNRHFQERDNIWKGGWRRYLFPGLWLIYLAQTVDGVHKHSHGVGAVAGYAIVAAFMCTYLLALPYAWMGQHRKFWTLYVLACLLTVAELVFARQDAFVFCVYIAVLTIGGARRFALPLVGAMVVIAAGTPALVPSWHSSVDYQTGLTIGLVAFAMYGFFSIIRSNIELAAARAEVARLAAENERSRIARDLHDLLGHSLTTITVKASLARRLAERGESERAAVEIAGVEELSRRSMADVRAAVSGYREVTLTGELASARGVLRAAGVEAKFPGAVDVVDADLQELFGWVVREGVTNVVRHARASTCTITMGPTWIEIVDDGRGSLASTAGTAGSGNGLSGMRERVLACGGTTEVGSCPKGWRVRVDLPSVASSRLPTVTPSGSTQSIPA